MIASLPVRLLLTISLVLALGAPPAIAADERLSLDWLFSDDGKAALAIPQRTWLADGTLVIYDDRKPKAERTLERVDPQNGRRRALVDGADAVAAMNAALEPDEPVEEPGWPDGFGPDGRYAIYEKSDDIWLLDLRNAEFVDIAATAAVEKSARFSPDGRKVAFVRDNDLWVHDVESGADKQLTSDGSETRLNGTLSWVYWEEVFGRSDRGYSWSPDSSAIAYLQSDESPVGEMHYVDFEPNLPDVIHQRHPKAGTDNPYIRAGVVTLADAETTWIDLGSNPYEYMVRLDWLPDAERLAVQVLNRPQTTLDLFIADAADGEAEHLLRETNDGWVNVHDDLHFLGNGDGFVWLSERDGHAQLYHYDMNGELRRQVTRGDWAVKSSGGPPGLDRAVLHVDEDAGTLWFTALEKASTERHLYRVNLDGSGFERVTEAAGSHAIDFAPDGGYYVDRYSSHATPPSLSVHRAGGERTATIAAADTAHVERFDLRTPELFTVEARDGYAMPASILKPRSFDPTREYPAVLYVYSGPSAPTVVDAWSTRARSYFHQLLADAGVIVFQVDNRSAAGRSKTDANVILERLYGEIELNDLLDGVAWLKSQPYIDDDRVGIWGWSGGGTMTMSAMTGSEEFAAGVAVAGVTDWHYYDTIYTERYMRRPQDNPEGYAATSLVDKAEQLSGRLFLVHGTYDDNVHPQNSWAFADALIDGGILFDMMIYPMRKHGITDDEAQRHLYASMLAFWRRELDLDQRGP